MTNTWCCALLVFACAAGAPANAAEVDCVPQTAIDVATIMTQIVLVGETHGTREMPRFVAGLICSLLQAGRPVMLAIEHSSEEQAALNRYLDSAGTPEDRSILTAGRSWHASDQYGLTSEAMLALIDSMRSLRQQKQPVGVLAIDQGLSVALTSGSTDEKPLSNADNLELSDLRDRAMADRLLGAAVLDRNYTIVSLTGSFHASNRRGTGDDPERRPMAYWIEEQEPAFIVGFDAPPGFAWVCTRSGCGSQPRAGGRLFVDGARTDTRVALPSMTASPPAVASRP